MLNLFYFSRESYIIQTKDARFLNLENFSWLWRLNFEFICVTVKFFSLSIPALEFLLLGICCQLWMPWRILALFSPTFLSFVCCNSRGTSIAFSQVSFPASIWGCVTLGEVAIDWVKISLNSALNLSFFHKFSQLLSKDPRKMFPSYCYSIFDCRTLGARDKHL